MKLSASEYLMTPSMTDQWQIDIGSGNGLVLLSNKPLPQTILAQIFIAVVHRTFGGFL